MLAGENLIKKIPVMVSGVEAEVHTLKNDVRALLVCVGN